MHDTVQYYLIPIKFMKTKTADQLATCNPDDQEDLEFDRFKARSQYVLISTILNWASSCMLDFGLDLHYYLMVTTRMWLKTD